PDLRRAVEPRHRDAAVAEHQHGGGPSREHHERARRAQDRGARRLRHPARPRRSEMTRRDFLRAMAASASGAALRPPSPTLGRPGAEARVRLTDVTQAAGIAFRHTNGAYGGKLLPETLGSGCAFLDYDGDGWVDILLVNGSSWPGHHRQRSTL